MGSQFKHCGYGFGLTPAHPQVDDEKLGPLDLISKSMKLVLDNAATSTCIQLTIVLPATIAMLMNHCFFYAIAHKFLPYPRPPTSQDDLEQTGPDVRLLIFIGVILLVIGFALTVNLVAAIFYAVSILNTGKSITFEDVLRALPGQWKGVAVTGLWGELFFAGLALFLILSQVLIMMFFDVSRVPWPVLIIVTFSVSRSFVFFIVTTLQMAYAVTVFEKIDGFATFVRGWKLLKHKWSIALGIFVILEVPRTLLGDILSEVLKSQQRLELKVLFAVVVVVHASLLTLVCSISNALLYTTCDFCLDEESLHTKDQCRSGSGYQRIDSS